MEKSLTECVAEVKEDLALHTGYELNDEQCDELRLTGRIGIDADKFLPCLKWAFKIPVTISSGRSASMQLLMILRSRLKATC